MTFQPEYEQRNKGYLTLRHKIQNMSSKKILCVPMENDVIHPCGEHMVVMITNSFIHIKIHNVTLPRHISKMF